MCFPIRVERAVLIHLRGQSCTEQRGVVPKGVSVDDKRMVFLVSDCEPVSLGFIPFLMLGDDSDRITLEPLAVVLEVHNTKDRLASNS